MEDVTIFIVIEYTSPVQGGEIDHAFETREAAQRYILDRQQAAARSRRTFPASITEVVLTRSAGLQ